MNLVNNPVQALNHHRVVATTLLVGTLVVLLVRPLTVLFYGVILDSQDVLVPAARSVVNRVPKIHPFQHATRHKAVPVELTGVPLKSMWRAYTGSFSGKVYCNNQPCAARVRLTIDRDGSESPVNVTVNSQSDGT